MGMKLISIALMWHGFMSSVLIAVTFIVTSFGLRHGDNELVRWAMDMHGVGFVALVKVTAVMLPSCAAIDLFLWVYGMRVRKSRPDL